MSLLATLWSLLPIPIGIFCLFWAWRIPFQNTDNESSSPEEQIGISDQQLMRDIGEDAQEIPPIEGKREVYFVILFTGLGIGAILVGMEVFHPYFVYAGKLTFLLTILASIIVPLCFKEKEPATNDGDGDANTDDNNSS